MADIANAVYSRLSGFSALTALVSTRIFAITAPQNVTYPCVTFQKVSSVRHPAFNVDSGVVSSRFQITAFAQEYSEGGGDVVSAMAVIEQVRTALQRFRGTISTSAGDVIVQDVQVDGEIHLAEPTNKTMAVSMDFIFHHRE